MSKDQKLKTSGQANIRDASPEGILRIISHVDLKTAQQLKSKLIAQKIKFTPDQYHQALFEALQESNDAGLKRLFKYKHNLVKGEISEQTLFSFVLEHRDEKAIYEMMDSQKISIPNPKTINWQKIAIIEQEEGLPIGGKKQVFDNFIITKPHIAASGRTDLLSYKKKLLNTRVEDLVKASGATENALNANPESFPSILKKSMDGLLIPIDDHKAEAIKKAIDHFHDSIREINDAKDNQRQPQSLIKKIAYKIEEFLHSIAEFFIGSVQDKLLKLTFKDIKHILLANDIRHTISSNQEDIDHSLDHAIKKDKPIERSSR